MSKRVRKVLAVHGQLVEPLAKMKNSDDLYEAGMTSHASVNLMLALENEFGVEIPESKLRRSTFQTIDDICRMLKKLDIKDSA